MTEDRRAALHEVIAVLESARSRKPMFFSPVEPNVLNHWLAGLRVGLMLFGLEWSPEHRRIAVEGRGLGDRAEWETEQLEGRGLTPAEIVDEMLVIEIEMWRAVGELVA